MCNLIPIFFSSLHTSHADNHFYHGKSWFCFGNQFNSLHSLLHPNSVLNTCICVTAHFPYTLTIICWIIEHAYNILCKLKFDTPKYEHLLDSAVLNATLEYATVYKIGTKSGNARYVRVRTNIAESVKPEWCFKCEKCLMCNCMGSWYSCFGRHCQHGCVCVCV